MTVELLNMDCMEYLRDCEDNVFDLVIVDPPYYQVKGEFDFVWKSFSEYLEDVDRWAAQIKRVANDSCSIFWWGNSKKIAYTQIILDKYFNLENSMIWEKIDSIQYQYYSPELARCFNTHNERLLYYSCEVGQTGREFVEENYIAPRNPFSIYLRAELSRAGVKASEIAALFPSRTGGLTGCVSNWLNGDNVITKDQYETIREYLNGDYLRQEYEDLRQEYEDLRQEYEDLRRPFKNDIKLTEVLRFSQQSQETKHIKHPTQKPPTLVNALVSVTRRSGGRALVPFMGSGVEVIACHKQGMSVTGIEIDEDYYKAACERFEKETAQMDLLA